MGISIQSRPTASFTAATALFLIGSLGFVWASRMGNPTDVRPWVLGALAFLSASYGATLWTARNTLPRITLKHVLVVAITARVILLFFSYPTLSDDIWRYLWDGHLQTQGVHPYVHAPNAPETLPWRTPLWSLINHPEVPTIYPPASQLIFALSASIASGSVACMRLLMVLAEVSTLFAIWTLCGVGIRPGVSDIHDRRVWCSLVFLFNPLTLVEFSGSGHLDTLAISPLVWALALVRPTGDRGTLRAPTELWRWALSGALIALSISAKLLGFFALPLIAACALYLPSLSTERGGSFSIFRRVSRILAFGGSSLVVLVLTFLPYATPWVFGESAMFGRGFSTYARKWRGNDGVFALVMEVQRSVLVSNPHGERAYWRFDALATLFNTVGMTHKHEGKMVASTAFGVEELAAALTKGWVAIALVILVLFCLHQRTRAFNATACVLAALLLLAPTVHPWYVAWLVPFAVVLRSKTLLVWSVLVFLIYAEGWLGASVVLRVAEYVPVWGLLIWEVGRRVAMDDPNDATWLVARSP